jgi:hypothetical protein
MTTSIEIKSALLDEWSPSYLSTLSTEKLRELLHQGIGEFANRLMNVAKVWIELERRGEDLSDLRVGLNKYLPAIAAGTVLAETVARFSCRPTILKAISQLTPSQQQQLIDIGTVRIVIKQGDNFTHRMLPLTALTVTQIRQVFGDRIIRNEVEQLAILESPKSNWTPKLSAKYGKVHADRGTGMVRIGRSMATAEDVIAALRGCGMIS